MRLSSYTKADGSHSYGLATSSGLKEAHEALKRKYPTLKAVLEAGALAELEAEADQFETIDQAGVTLLAPVTQPGKVICIGLNYMAHIKETGRETPAYPSIFTRYPESIVGAGSPMVRPKVSDKLDFEGELAVVIGKTGRHVGRADAMAHVAGYACFNDGSVRDFQRHTSQFWAGKNFSGSGAAGPCLVTRDEIVDVSQLTLQTRLNGEVMQSTSIGDLCFDIPSLIEYLSSVIELLPGDVIATGTPSGVGLFRQPPVWMKPGDLVEVEITGLGVLANPIIDEQ